jgi:filamin
MKEGAPLRAKSVPSKVRAYGPGLEPVGVAAKAPANFTVETLCAGDGELSIRWSE